MTSHVFRDFILDLSNITYNNMVNMTIQPKPHTSTSGELYIFFYFFYSCLTSIYNRMELVRMSQVDHRDRTSGEQYIGYIRSSRIISIT